MGPKQICQIPHAAVFGKFERRKRAEAERKRLMRAFGSRRLASDETPYIICFLKKKVKLLFMLFAVGFGVSKTAAPDKQ